MPPYEVQESRIVLFSNVFGVPEAERHVAQLQAMRGGLRVHGFPVHLVACGSGSSRQAAGACAV